MSLVMCLPILAQACPLFRPKLGYIWSQNMPFLRYTEFVASGFDECFRQGGSGVSVETPTRSYPGGGGGNERYFTVIPFGDNC